MGDDRRAGDPARPRAGRVPDVCRACAWRRPAGERRRATPSDAAQHRAVRRSACPATPVRRRSQCRVHCPGALSGPKRDTPQRRAQGRFPGVPACGPGAWSRHVKTRDRVRRSATCHGAARPWPVPICAVGADLARGRIAPEAQGAAGSGQGPVAGSQEKQGRRKCQGPAVAGLAERPRAWPASGPHLARACQTGRQTDRRTDRLAARCEPCMFLVPRQPTPFHAIPPCSAPDHGFWTFPCGNPTTPSHACTVLSYLFCACQHSASVPRRLPVASSGDRGLAPGRASVCLSAGG